MLLILLKTDLKLRQLEFFLAVNLVNRKHLIKIVTSNLMIKLRMLRLLHEGEVHAFASMTPGKNYGESYAHEFCAVSSLSSVTSNFYLYVL